MTQIYTFRITYRGCEEKIWRVAEVSSNNTLAQLGYTILRLSRLHLAAHEFPFEAPGLVGWALAGH